jgi:hypothetical protein
MTDIISEILTWMNGIGNMGIKGNTEIQYSTDKMPLSSEQTTIKFNTDPQNVRVHPVDYGPLNPPRNGIKFNI